MKYCQYCGNERNEGKTCKNCGRKYGGRSLFPSVLLIFVFVIAVSFFVFDQQFLKSINLSEEQVDSAHMVALQDEMVQNVTKSELNDEQKTELTEVIAEAQKSVYTIFTSMSQGSGFLYNDSGAVVTNAHVVEGVIDVQVKTVSGEELPGKVIGYSSETDVAVIEVPSLAGQKPYPIEKNEEVMIGEEVIALGSPLGLENTATMGYVTGKNRNFTIGHYTYETVYQMSAPVSPGSSGGPLIAKNAEKVIAINSATSLEGQAIGFSIPIFKVAELIDAWIETPMSEEEILEQFYNANGGFFFDELWNYGDGYFNGGEYAIDDWYYDYWEYDYDWFWDDNGYELWDYDDYDGWYGDYDYYLEDDSDDWYYDYEDGYDYNGDSWYDYEDDENRWYYDQYEYFYGEFDGDEWSEEEASDSMTDM